MSADLLIEKLSDGIYSYTLNRPQSGNSLSPAFVETIHNALDESEAGGMRALVLRGEGKNFCTGFDLSDISETDDAMLLMRFIRIEQLLARIWAAPYATIAIAHGRVFGAGADLFASCGHRLAVDQASFSFPGAGFGLVLGTRRLAVRIGQSAAEYLVTNGHRISSDEARLIGLATEHLTCADLESGVTRVLTAGSRLDPMTFAAIRRAAANEGDALDCDLAALVRSAARPGLRDRIIEYRNQSIQHIATEHTS